MSLYILPLTFFVWLYPVPLWENIIIRHILSYRLFLYKATSLYACSSLNNYVTTDHFVMVHVCRHFCRALFPITSISICRITNKCVYNSRVCASDDYRPRLHFVDAFFFSYQSTSLHNMIEGREFKNPVYLHKLKLRLLLLQEVVFHIQKCEQPSNLALPTDKWFTTAGKCVPFHSVQLIGSPCFCCIVLTKHKQASNSMSERKHTLKESKNVVGY